MDPVATSDPSLTAPAADPVGQVAPAASVEPQAPVSADPAPAAPPAQPSIDWQALATQREEQLQAAMQEVDGFRNRYAGIDDPAAARRALDDLQSRNRHQEDPFAADHPRLAQSQDSVRRAQAWLDAIGVLPEDQRKAYGPQLAAKFGVTQADLQLHDQFKRRRDGFERELYDNPDAFVNKRIETAIKETEERVVKRIFAQLSANAWSEENQDFLSRNAQELHRLVSPQTKSSDRINGLKDILAENEQLRQKLGMQARGSATAAAQAAVRQAVPTARQPASQVGRITDPGEYVAKHFPNMAKGSPAWNSKIIEITQKMWDNEI